MSIAEESKDLFGFLDELKKCTECGEMLPLTMFAKDSGANYYKGKCKPCTKKHDDQLKELKKKHPPPTEPNYCCPICERNAQKILDKGHKVRWCLDHDHNTGEFRGYICSTCNTGIANLHEDPDVLQNAVNYLKEHNERIMD